MSFHTFQDRHIGPRGHEVDQMLKAINCSSVDQLIDETVPQAIKLEKPLNIASGISEFEYQKHIHYLASLNKVYKTYIGQGYYNTIVPAVIQRNILENPGWYTAYTPYQAEIAQGRLEALLNFQTMVSDLTKCEIANASLLDEGTAAAEAMIMFYNSRSRAAQKNNVIKFFVDTDVFGQTIDVIKTRAIPLGIELVFGNALETTITNEFFGALVQYPNKNGELIDYTAFIESAHAVECKVVVASDLMALLVAKAPGDMQADCVVGNTQRFGVPLGFGGPHAAFFATRDEFKRHIPGRIIGVSVDAQGNVGFRMALQTREQHIKRDKATSNICTAQALLAIMASMYAVYHGPKGLRSIATDIHVKAVTLKEILEDLGYKVENTHFFDTLTVNVQGTTVENLVAEADASGINLWVKGNNQVGVSFNETISIEDIHELVNVFAKAANQETVDVIELATDNTSLAGFERSVDYLMHPVFNSYHSESEMMRYIKRLENKDISLMHSMISLGSCTMKLNAASELYPITMPEFANIHPFAPSSQTQGYQQMLRQLEKDLCEVTGFDAMSMQPNSGAQGEYAGLMVIRAYHIANGDSHRNICLIPSSAHGTNPASAVMAGMQVVVTKCDEQGNIDVEDLRAKAEQYKDTLAALMVTYPSTHGVFEESIKEITNIVHAHGGQVYMDGANMNAQVGLTNPATIGADVCHLNLHKTFAIPHGGGGPGMGPIGVKKHLVPFLPGHVYQKVGGDQGITAISAAPYGSALILLISYGYIKMLGAKGLTDSTKYAILNANYMKARLSGSYDALYVGANGRVAHEMIIDCRDFKKVGVEVADIAKRLMDYGFHAPTVSFPVAGTLMVEPTESESKAEMDRFCDAMIEIRKEIAEIENGTYSQSDNVLINAPHTSEVVTSDSWVHSYSRQKAAYPLPYIKEAKVWPSVGRVDNAYGDRNLICTCPPLEMYETTEA